MLSFHNRLRGKSDQERFEAQYTPEPNTGCWLWVGFIDHGGYGKIQAQGRPRRAHRYALEQATGKNPSGLFACHRCDQPACVNPAHLFWGTARDNNHDMIAKGRERYLSGADHPMSRHPENARRGARHHKTKMVEADVAELRRLRHKGFPLKVLSEWFKVRESTVSRIANGVRWAN